MYITYQYFRRRASRSGTQLTTQLFVPTYIWFSQQLMGLDWYIGMAWSDTAVRMDAVSTVVLEVDIKMLVPTTTLPFYVRRTHVKIVATLISRCFIFPKLVAPNTQETFFISCLLQINDNMRRIAPKRGS